MSEAPADADAYPADDGLGVLVDSLGVETDELAVATLITYAPDPADMHLVGGSIIVGPPEMAQTSWPRWAAQQGDVRTWQWLDPPGHPYLDAAEFVWMDGPWTLVRFVLDPTRLEDWIRSAFNRHSISEIIDSTPVAMRVDMKEVRDLLHVSPHAHTPAGMLCTFPGRPFQGWAHRLDVPSGMPTKGEGIDLPEMPLAGVHHDAPTFVAGINRVLEVGPPTELVIGRLARNAWIADVRGADKMEQLNIQIGLDPARISLWDLEVEVEEHSTGNLVYARRTALELFVLPVHGAERVTVQLPTLGSGMQRRVRLWDRSGVLLDWTDVVGFFEKMVITMSHLDDPNKTVISRTEIGSTTPIFAPTRLAAMDRIQREYQEELERGAEQRQLIDPTRAAQAVAARLSGARGHVDICDPYFGQSRNDKGWDLIGSLSVPIRLITGKAVKVPSSLSHVQARSFGAIPPFHDRLYLWSGGGMTVGTSPNGLGKRFALVQPLSPQDVASLQARYDAWWQAAT